MLLRVHVGMAHKRNRSVRVFFSQSFIFIISFKIVSVAEVVLGFVDGVTSCFKGLRRLKKSIIRRISSRRKHWMI